MIYAKLEEMRQLSRGNPQKMAEYAQAKHSYDEVARSLFNKESGVEFVNHPNESYVTELERIAEASNDLDDKARAELMRDRYESNEDAKTFHGDLRVTANKLRTKLDSGQPLTRRDVSEAWKLAKLQASPDNVVLYSAIKREHENPTEKSAASNLETTKVTAEDVEKARQAAKENPSIRNLAAYATAKSEYEEVQTGAGE